MSSFANPFALVKSLFSKPKAPKMPEIPTPPTRSDEAVQEEAKKKRALMQLQQGRESTDLTKGRLEGTQPAGYARKQLLGE